MPFRIADDPNIDYKTLVEEGYDHCAPSYSKDRSDLAERELNLVTDRLSHGSSVLDVGCGSGVPIAGYLAKHYKVTGVDISTSMIELAKRNVPSGRLIKSDIMSVNFEKDAFDAIVSFYSVFHVPRDEHQELFRRFALWLRPGGFLLVTLALQDEGRGYTEDDFFGVTMYWSNFGIETYRHMLRVAGFRIENEAIIGHGYENPNVAAERHPFIFAVKHNKNEGS